MKWFVLLTLLACNSQQTTTKVEAEALNDEETVSCVCNKIFQPVCAEGRTFPNACEAECQGFKDWREGSCE